MTQFRCPVCGEPLSDTPSSLVCPRRHSYDRARSGYVNLLPPSGHGKRHGDDKKMVLARRDFLSRGYYDPFSAAVTQAVCRLAPSPCVLLDCGCGEGKYTADVLAGLTSAGKEAQIFGIDISKDAVACAARRSSAFRLAAASCAAIPMADSSADLLLNLFSPFMPAEYSRVLKPGGFLLRAFPLEQHLQELRALIYDRPILNPPTPLEAEGLELTELQKVCYRIHVPSQEDLHALFLMTPYYYKTGRADQEKLASVQEADIGLEFGIAIYRKPLT